MTKIYLVRHGQTEWNKELRFRGRVDIPLNEMGRRQAEAIANALEASEITRIYTSPLRRSIETAQPTAKLLNLTIEPAQGLVDISYGEWEGLAFSTVKKRYGNLYQQWEKRPHVVRFPNGETLDEARERSFRTIKTIIKGNPGKAVLVIPHRVINKVLLCAILKLSNSHFWEIKQDTGCINLIEYSNKRFVVCTMNDTCHLREIDGQTVQPDF